jgi:prepilin-type N-terminal cleavage/methylation domain-containing protein
MGKILKNYQGMSLIEVIVAIGIFSLGIAGFSTLFVKSWQTNAYIYETGQDSFIASRSVSLVVEDLRRAKQAENGDYLIKSASNFDLIVFIDVDNDNEAEKVHYFLDQNTDELKRGISQPSSSNPPSYSSGDDSIEVLASHIVNNSDNPLFSYFSNNYISDQTPFDVPVASGELINIRLVKVKLLVDIRPYHSPDYVTIESFAKLRNI